MIGCAEDDRLTIGRCDGRLLACEPQASLAVIGPTGCGKTAGFAIPALLEWRGPIIATSVKTDLIEATVDLTGMDDRPESARPLCVVPGLRQVL